MTPPMDPGLTKQAEHRALLALLGGADPDGGLDAAMRAFARYYGPMLGTVRMTVFERLRDGLARTDPETAAGLKLHNVFNRHSQFLAPFLDGPAASAETLFYRQGKPDIFETTEITPAGPNQWQAEIVPPRFNMTLRQPHRPAFSIHGAQGRELFVSPFGFQYFDRGSGLSWAEGSTRAFGRGVDLLPTVDVDRPVVVVQDHFDAANFCHFIYDAVPRVLAFATRFPDLARRALFVMGSSKTPLHRLFFERFHALFGIEPAQFYFPARREVLRPRQGVHFFSDLAHIMHPLQFGSPTVIAGLRAAVAALDRSGPQPAHLYVSRADAAMRRLTNEDALMVALLPRGFVRVVLSEHDVARQIALLAGARVVVGPHGMGLTHIVFNPGPLRLIELFSHTNGSDSYAFAARATGAEYGYVSASRMTPQTPGDYEVDVAEVLATLDA